MKLTGTIINYYFHCKRQCWLFSNRVNLEDNSEDVHIGRILHQIEHDRKKDTEIKIDNIAIDRITPEYLIEIKKSDADVEATKWQTLFYLKVLSQKGIHRKGKIEFLEKNKQDKKVIFVELDENAIKKLEDLENEINDLVSEATPPNAINNSKCKKCAYYEYCYI
ncbi:UNVERIFIED_CONTAM: CRISPR-associated exonuclease Cas4 [Acetivibrio alkalicellulosi]